MSAEALAMQLLEAWNDRDLNAFVELLHEDVIWYDPAMPAPPARGRAAVRSFCETVLRAFPDFTYTVRGQVCVSSDGARCVVPWKISATHSDWMRPPGFAPTGQRVELDGVDLIDVVDGTIVRIETYFDPVPAGEQLLRLRIRPAPGGILERTAVLIQRARAGWIRKTGE